MEYIISREAAKVEKRKRLGQTSQTLELDRNQSNRTLVFQKYWGSFLFFIKNKGLKGEITCIEQAWQIIVRIGLYYNGEDIKKNVYIL
jgi:hypothetical protein